MTDDMTEEEIPLVGEGSEESIGVSTGREEGSKIRRIGGTGETSHKVDFKRPLNLDGTGATRMRLFSAKLSATSRASMERQINEWLDAEKVEIKAVSSEIGTMQDKIREENIILCLWY